MACESHCRIFGDTDVPIPKTTTQEQLESGTQSKSQFRKVAKAQINFVTYPMNDFRFNNYGPIKNPKDFDQVATATTYREVYKTPKPLVKKVDICEDVLDPLLNRIPKNDFEMLPSSTNKFMDDHLVMVSESRKRINLLRQLRNVSNIF